MYRQFHKNKLHTFLVVICFVIAIATFFISRFYYINASYHKRLQRITNAKIILEKAFLQDLEIIYSVRNFFSAQKDVSREQFKKFVSPALAEHKEIQALEYMIKLPHSARRRHEQKMQAEGFSGFRITEQRSDQIVTASERTEYYVIHYAEPLEPNLIAIGYDISFTQPAREALEHALHTGVGVSPLLKLAQGQTGFVVYASIEDSKDLVAGVFSLKNFFESALRAASVTGFDFIIEPVNNHSRKSQTFKFDAHEGVMSEIERIDFERSKFPSVLLHLDNQSFKLTHAPRNGYPVKFSKSLMISVGVLLLLLASVFMFLERDARLKAQAAAKVREDFLTIVSHELRTPLTPLKMELFLLQEMFRKGDVNQIKTERLIDGANKQLGHIVALIDDLLDLGKFRAGKFQFQFADFNLTDLITDVIERYNVSLQANGCTVKLDLQDNVLVHWDARRIEQVITNCLSNIIKFAAGKPVEITLRQDGETVELRIKDFGMGIEKDFQKNIFNRFERGVSTNSYGGIGIGLYIVREIIHAHSGQIEVRSEVGQGTEFIFKVPRRV
jgi:signal transduction histidine kinase